MMIDLMLRKNTRRTRIETKRAAMLIAISCLVVFALSQRTDSILMGHIVPDESRWPATAHNRPLFLVPLVADGDLLPRDH